MSLWSDYYNETGHLKVIEIEAGFVTYQINGLECNIQDFFIAMDFRSGAYAKELERKVEEEGRRAGCKFLSTQVNLKVKEPQRSRLVKMHLIRGMTIVNVDPQAIHFIKELK